MKILMVEDDRELSEVTRKQLEASEYQVDCAYDGEEALYYLENGAYEVILLDWMLPEKDGLEVLKELREMGILTPVIMLTALDGVHNRIDGLDAGADDYLVKPYEVEELKARIRALLRRPRTLVETEKLVFEDLKVDEKEGVLYCGEETRTLSKKETELLAFFMRNGNQILSKEQILFSVWGMDSSVEYGNIENYIYFLRRKLKALPTKVQISTVHGMGYRMECKK